MGNRFSLNDIAILCRSNFQVTVLGEDPADGFRIDDQVAHPVFGKGVITEVNARSRTYVVKFEGMEIQKPISFDFKRMTKLKGGEHLGKIAIKC